MPRASLSGYSNALSGENVQYDSEPDGVREDEEVESSAGTSSLTSESKPDKSGTSSMTGPQSPAPMTDSPSSKDQLPSQESSTARSTGGSGRGTTSARRNRQASSADSRQREQATPDQGTSEEDPGSGGFLVP